MNLTILDFGFNNIQTISPEINRLQNLKKLYLNNNPVQYIPVELTECRQLSYIDLSNTYVKILPREIILLRNLYYLKLENCPLHEKIQKIYDTGLPNLLEYFQGKMDHANWRAKIIQKLKEWHFTSNTFEEIQEMMEDVMFILKDVTTNDLKRLNKNAERIFPRNIEDVDP
jgi:Leucine-rich repeat (LRR) protein